jgi:hypothetical protein
MPRMHHFGFRYFIKNIWVAIGIVIIWRGIWVLLDLLDQLLFGSNHIVTAIGGIIAGVLILYFSEEGLEALERL